MSTTPEALRLADQAADMARMFTAPSHERGVLHGCAQELRRLAAVEAERDQLREVIADKNAALDLMRQAADQLRAEVEALKAAARQDTQEKKCMT